MLLLDAELPEERQNEIVARIRELIENARRVRWVAPRAVGPAQARVRDRPEGGGRLPPAPVRRRRRRRSTRSPACCKITDGVHAAHAARQSAAQGRRRAEQPSRPAGEPRMQCSTEEGRRWLATSTASCSWDSLTRDPELAAHCRSGSPVLAARAWPCNGRQKDADRQVERQAELLRRDGVRTTRPRCCASTLREGAAASASTGGSTGRRVGGAGRASKRPKVEDRRRHRCSSSTAATATAARPAHILHVDVSADRRTAAAGATGGTDDDIPF